MYVYICMFVYMCHCMDLKFLLLGHVHKFDVCYLTNMTHIAIIQNEHIDPTCLQIQKNCNRYSICYCCVCSITVFFYFSTKRDYVTAMNQFSHQNSHVMPVLC